MPIRFACPHCRQKLSISSRRAGQSANCPRCKRSISIPSLPPQPESAAPALPLPSGDSLGEGVGERTKPEPLPAAPEPSGNSEVPLPSPLAGDEGTGQQPPIESAVNAESVDKSDVPHPGPRPEGEGPSQPAAGEPAFAPDAAEGFEGFELIYDAPPPASAIAPPVAADLIAVPRYAIYLQGGLLAVVAFVAFVIGILAGGTLLSGPAAPPAPQACLISGSITYASGPRQLPDEGAVVAVIPQTHERPDEKAPIVGLRPGDPSPDADHRGIAILRELGGGYTRADAGGRFQIQVPSQGRYLVLVISHEKPARSADEINTADILKLGPYFANAADLLGDRRYQLTQETLRGDKQLRVAFQ